MNIDSNFQKGIPKFDGVCMYGPNLTLPLPEARSFFQSSPDFRRLFLGANHINRVGAEAIAEVRAVRRAGPKPKGLLIVFRTYIFISGEKEKSM